MTLKNLLGVSLEAIEPDGLFLMRLLAAADRNINDANIPSVSAENRFDVAYKAIMQLAMAALHANGYRTLTSKPGHHQTAIQIAWPGPEATSQCRFVFQRATEVSRVSPR